MKTPFKIREPSFSEKILSGEITPGRYRERAYRVAWRGSSFSLPANPFEEGWVAIPIFPNENETLWAVECEKDLDGNLIGGWSPPIRVVTQTIEEMDLHFRSAKLATSYEESKKGNSRGLFRPSIEEIEDIEIGTEFTRRYNEEKEEFQSEKELAREYAINIHGGKGLLEQMRESGSVVTYEKLTYESLKEKIDSLFSVASDPAVPGSELVVYGRATSYGKTLTDMDLVVASGFAMMAEAEKKEFKPKKNPEVNKHADRSQWKFRK